MGSFSILNNISALYAENQLTVTNTSLNQTLQRLSSGKRINSGADDAAGLMISDTLDADVTALNQGVQNANDCISVGQIADGALQEIGNLLTSAVTLAEESATNTVDSTGRTSLNNEFAQIQAEIAQIATQTNYNGQDIFTTGGLNGSLSVFVGDLNTNSSIAVAIGTITTSGNTVTEIGTTGSSNLAGVSLTTQTGAQTALGTIKTALGAVNSLRASIGDGINRLQAAVSVLQAQSQNTQAAESQLMDANIAQEVTNLTKYQILAQTGMAALAQANQGSQLVLNLLK